MSSPDDRLSVPDEERLIDQFFHDNSRSTSVCESLRRRLTAFVQEHVAQGRKIALVTSGGTTVPLESNTVRFLDNFSTGSRGSALTESLLEAGYAVVLFHRSGSLLPFAAPFVDAFDGYGVYHMLQATDDGALTLRHAAADDAWRQQLLRSVQRYQRAVGEGAQLFRVQFRSVQDYLVDLRTVTSCLDEHGAFPLQIMAAAVSDFYVPVPAEHKIQSGGALTLTLEPVPKMLGRLVSRWCRRSLIVSFKLETDAALLTKKAARSMERDQQHVVVANMLQTRKERLDVLLRADVAAACALAPLTPIERGDAAAIEPALVTFLTRVHATLAATLSPQQ